jgi:hypothetical protein
VKISGDKQARFLEKSLVFFSNQQSAFSIQHSANEGLPQRTRRGAKRTRLETLNSKRGRKLEKYRNLSTAKVLSNPAAYNRAPFGLGARLFRDDRVHHGAWNNAFDPTLGGSG